MALYETTIVIDSFLKEEDFANLATKIQNFIKNNGGQIRQVEEWGKRRLAYEINRKQYGNYLHITFESSAALPLLLEREYRLQETIMRFMTIKQDPKELAAKEAEKARLSAANAEAVAVQPASSEVSGGAGEL